jgi:hypothetical protein
LHRHGKHQTCQQGAQIAIGRQDQQAAGAATRQDHARAETQATQHGPRNAAGHGDVAGIGRFEPARHDQQLPTRAAPKASHQTLKRSPVRPSQHSTTAARAQNRVRCAANPKMKPTNAPAMSSTFESPQVSSQLATFTDFSNNSLSSYICGHVIQSSLNPRQNPLFSTFRIHDVCHALLFFSVFQSA